MALMISQALWMVAWWYLKTRVALSSTTRPAISAGSCVATPVGQWFVLHLRAWMKVERARGGGWQEEAEEEAEEEGEEEKREEGGV
jgi:hypothetical protein